ncbi:double-strand-break repair protein (MRE11) [Vairimorpha necatrix]|uniref:Double-strand-break repair protein (MRE11) n=1 Tax=Vairimorpha necatrix TaxID=6039 RepID=A0AAX4JE71_9MICR
MKILITSDNHLGYKESDPLRHDDSFNTFDEILKLAVFYKVDLILQVGDFYHENRPSRYCINRSINILRKHLTETSKDKDEFKDGHEHEYKEEYDEHIYMNNIYKVNIPMICIHGNHDDPSGFNKISTLDILNSAGLISYIGKDINPCPFLQYDNIRIYGVGYIKDKDVSDLFKNIIFKDLSSDFFNILLVHQNRVPRNRDYLCPSVIPHEFNLVVYGHEHDPLIIRNKTLLLQCGSTVRTSLSEAECNEKYCYILEDEDKLYKIRLNSVRPFIMEDSNLYEEKEIIEYINKLLETKLNQKDKSNLKEYYVDVKDDESNLKDDHVIKDRDDKIHDDIKRQKHFNDNMSINVMNMLNPLKYSPLLPLVRLRIFTTNTLNINKNRLSHIFKDKVSNPQDMIKLIPPKKVKNKSSTIVYQSQNITEIISSHLKCTPLECIPEYKFIEHFNKDSTFIDMIEENVEEYSKEIQYENCMIEDLRDEIRKIKDKLSARNKYEDQVEDSQEDVLQEDVIDGNEDVIDGNEDQVEDSQEDVVHEDVIDEYSSENEPINVEEANNNNTVNINIEDNNNIVDINIEEANKYTVDMNNDVRNILVGRDSKTVRMSLNNNVLVHEDIISDFSKEIITSSSFIKLEDSKSGFIKTDESGVRKIYEEEDSTDLLIDF